MKGVGLITIATIIAETQGFNQINNGNLQVKVLKSEDRWYGVTYQEDKPIVQEAFSKLVQEGRYPAPLWGAEVNT